MIVPGLSLTLRLQVTYLAYRIPRIRTWLMVVCQCGTILASLLLWQLPRSSKGGLLFGCFILASFGGSYALLMGLQIANTAGYTKRSGMGHMHRIKGSADALQSHIFWSLRRLVPWEFRWPTPFSSRRCP